LRAGERKLIYPHMSTNNTVTQPPAPRRPGRSAAAPTRPNRLVFRLVGIPLLAVAGLLLYRGLHDRFVLPECNSGRAKDTLADILKQLKVEPVNYKSIKTISSSKTEVVCNALLPLAEGGNLNIDYSFFWQGNNAQMKYSISRLPAQNSAINRPPAVPRSD
jgi:hypothetical protein